MRNWNSCPCLAKSAVWVEERSPAPEVSWEVLPSLWLSLISSAWCLPCSFFSWRLHCLLSLKFHFLPTWSTCFLLNCFPISWEFFLHNFQPSISLPVHKAHASEAFMPTQPHWRSTSLVKAWTVHKHGGLGSVMIPPAEFCEHSMTSQQLSWSLPLDYLERHVVPILPRNYFSQSIFYY